MNLLRLCLGDVWLWMRDNYLQLNPDKTEVLLVSTRQGLNRFAIQNISIANSQVTPAASVRNLGAIFDSCLRMEDHVNAVCKTAFFHLRNIARIRSYLDRGTTEKVVHAFVSSRLDYCNSLLFGMSNTLVAKLQRVQNMAARIVTGTGKYEHIRPVLYQLHWLPVKYRIEYKIGLIVFKCLHGLAPPYLSDLLKPYVPMRSLRSANRDLLQIPRSRLCTFGDKTFASFAPRLWNSLPVHLRQIESLSQFKSFYKTYLFSQCFIY